MLTVTRHLLDLLATHHPSPRTVAYLFCLGVVLLVADRVRQQLGLTDDDLDALGIVTFGVAFERYRHWMVVQAGYSQRTIGDYRAILYDFAATLSRDQAGQPRWGRAGPRQLERWLAMPARSGPRKGELLSVATRNHRTMVVRRFYEWAATCDPPLLAKHRMLGVRGPKLEQGPARALPDRMVAEILATAEASDERMGMICWLAYGGGLRCMEIATARIERIWEEGPDLVIEVHGKGRKVRKVPLHPASHEFIHAYLEHRSRSGPLVEGRDHYGEYTGRPMRPATISIVGGRWLRTQGFPASLHQLRHSLGTQLRRNGVDLEVIAVILGHARIETTRIYTKGAEPKVAEAMRGLPNPR